MTDLVMVTHGLRSPRKLPAAFFVEELDLEREIIHGTVTTRGYL